MQVSPTRPDRTKGVGSALTEPPRLAIVLPSARHVQVVVFDIQGKHVRYLRDEVMDAGEHSVAWDLRDDQGREVPRGVYFLKAWALGMVTRARLIVLDRLGG